MAAFQEIKTQKTILCEERQHVRKHVTLVTFGYAEEKMITGSPSELLHYSAITKHLSHADALRLQFLAERERAATETICDNELKTLG